LSFLQNVALVWTLSHIRRRRIRDFGEADCHDVVIGSSTGHERQIVEFGGASGPSKEQEAS